LDCITLIRFGVGSVDKGTTEYRGSVKNMWSGNGVTQSEVELLQSERKLTTKVENNLGLSLCAVPQSAVMCVVAYFRRTELLPGVQERSGILIRVRIEYVKDINDFNLQTKELGCN